MFKSYVSDLYNIKKNSTNTVQRNIAKLMLNSLYGRFGMKEITSQIKIMSNQVYSNKVDKYFNHTVLSELDNGFKLVRYGARIDDRIRKLIKYLENDSLEEMKMSHDINELKGFNKVRGLEEFHQQFKLLLQFQRMVNYQLMNLKIFLTIHVFIPILIVWCCSAGK